MKKLILLSFLFILAGCQRLPSKVENVSQVNVYPEVLATPFSKILLDAERRANPEGRKVLEVGREMALVERAVIKGSCWDYANAVFERAGYSYFGNREVVMHAKKPGFAAVDLAAIQPGDFLSYVNHSFNNIKHSAIFVDWLDFDRKIGLMLSYAGQGRKEPARYKPYDLSDVYYVARARS